MAEYTQTKFDSKSFNPVAFGKYIERLPATKRNELIKSRALKGNKQIREAFSSQTGTAYATLPMKGRIGGAPQNYDGQTNIEAQTTTTFERGVVVIGRAQAWTELDFSTDITGGEDFMDNVAAQVNEYWDGVDQDTLLAILEGIFAMSGAKNLLFVNNHTHDITAVEGEDKDGNALNRVGATSLNTAIQKASGDAKSKFSIVIMHSVVSTNLENLKLLAYLKYTDKDGITRDLGLGTWNGRAVLIDDGMPVTTDDTGEIYTTYLLGEGAFDYENIGAKVPYEMDRDPAVNGGQDTLYSRQRKVFAPFGISYTKKNQATNSPTDAELKDGGNWSLVHNGSTEYIEHKTIPIARIISRG